MSKKKNKKKKGGGISAVTQNKVLPVPARETAIIESKDCSRSVVVQNPSENPPVGIIGKIKKGWPAFSSIQSYCILYIIFGLIGIVLSIFSNGGSDKIGYIICAIFLPLLAFPLFAYERGSLSEEEKELRDNLFSSYSFGISLIISIMFGIGGSDMMTRWDLPHLPLGLFISLCLWEWLAFNKLAEKDKIALKHKKSRQLILMANGETFKLMDAKGKPICLPAPDDKKEKAD